MAEEASPELALKAAESLLEMQRNHIRELVADRDRLLAVVQSIADEPEIDGRCPECALDGYHEDWCFRGRCIAALEERQ